MKRYVSNQEIMSLLQLSVLQKVQTQVNSGLNFEDVNVYLKLLLFLKPIHSTWLVEMNDFLSFI